MHLRRFLNPQNHVAVVGNRTLANLDCSLPLSGRRLHCRKEEVTHHTIIKFTLSDLDSFKDGFASSNHAHGIDV